MQSIKRHFASALFALLLTTSTAFAGDFFEVDGLALRGYDPVAYFDAGRPVKGLEQHSFTYQGSRFLFASDENLRKFASRPENYAPQFGGYCALGTANGYKVTTEPDAFKVVNGKLYLNHNRQVQDIWVKDEAGNITRANANWPSVSKMPLKQ